MDITPLVESGSRIIQGYGPGSFRVSGTVYESAIVVFPDNVEEFLFSGDRDSLTVDDFNIVLKHSDDLDVILFGGGSRACFISPQLRREFSERGVNIESMDSGAACRTYNVLMAEGRRVAAVLLPVD